MKKIIFWAGLLLFLITPPLAFAKNENLQDNQNRQSRFELKIQGKTTGKEDNQSKTKIEADLELTKLNGQLETGGQGFELTGEISAVSDTSFVVSGRTIVIDLTKLPEFKQKGLLKIGERVKVKGILQNGASFAQEINVLGSGQGRFKFEIDEAKDHQTPSPTISITPTISATPSTDAKIKVKITGPIDQTVAFLKQVLSYLQGLI